LSDHSSLLECKLDKGTNFRGTEEFINKPGLLVFIRFDLESTKRHANNDVDGGSRVFKLQDDARDVVMALKQPLRSAESGYLRNRSELRSSMVSVPSAPRFPFHSAPRLEYIPSLILTPNTLACEDLQIIPNLLLVPSEHEKEGKPLTTQWMVNKSNPAIAEAALALRLSCGSSSMEIISPEKKTTEGPMSGHFMASICTLLAKTTKASIHMNDVPMLVPIRSLVT
jgi:hypothetical protein